MKCANCYLPDLTVECRSNQEVPDAGLSLFQYGFCSERLRSSDDIKRNLCLRCPKISQSRRLKWSYCLELFWNVRHVNVQIEYQVENACILTIQIDMAFNLNKSTRLNIIYGELVIALYIHYTFK